MSQIHKWSLCVSDVASAFLNTPIDESKGFIQDPCTFTGVDSKCHLNLMVMAYVDDLIVSGEAQAVQTFIQEIQKTFSLKHVDYLDNHVEFLGRIIKVKKSGQITMEFPQKLNRQSVRYFRCQREVNNKWSQDSAGSKGRSSQVRKRDAFKIQDSYREALVDVTTQR